ncbi:zinc finger MYND domain-containing protein 12 isoform X2 [Patagioenas fasciata]|uniref:zinc finger MYND domain-containing protein 12 isoform X2 n=1 Tax=Patagioenas fasciata TaxID=372321 RepID=UPI003A98FD8C
MVLGAPACGAVRSRLQRGLGQLRVAEGNLEQALHHLAYDVYLASSTFGPRSLEAAMGYFHMANVFFRQNKMDIANSLYAKVTSLWCDRLLSAVQAQERELRSRSDMSPFTKDEDVTEQQLTEAQRAEGTRVLSAMLEIRSQARKPELGEMARVLHGLAMLHYLGLDLPAAGEMGLKALELVKQLPQQESLEPITRLLRLINSTPSHTK